MARQGIDPSAGAVVMTSRLSVELVQKCAMAGVTTLIAVSAPTAHALRLATGAGLTVAAFARGGGFDLYAHPTGLPTRKPMSPEKMVRMANQIATFFKTQPKEDAAARVAAHIKDFWDPRMRAVARSRRPGWRGAGRGCREGRAPDLLTGCVSRRPNRADIGWRDRGGLDDGIHLRTRCNPHGWPRSLRDPRKNAPAAVSSATIAPGPSFERSSATCPGRMLSATDPSGRALDRITSCAAMRMRSGYFRGRSRAAGTRAARPRPVQSGRRHDGG